MDKNVPANTQEGRILRYMQTGNKITPIDALQLFGCMRLAARIRTLRQRGFIIITEDVQSPRNPHVVYGMYSMPTTN